MSEMTLPTDPNDPVVDEVGLHYKWRTHASGKVDSITTFVNCGLTVNQAETVENVMMAVVDAHRAMNAALRAPGYQDVVATVKPIEFVVPAPAQGA